MRRFVFACVLLCSLLVPIGAATPVGAQSTVSCSSFDAWEWAQSVFESDPQTYTALDPDGNGIACPELPHGGFAPAFWTDKIPADVEEAQIIRIIDGDTFEMSIGGVSNRVRIYRADTPETQTQHECGGQEATNFATYALGFNDTPNTVYLERDKTTRDKYGRELAYVWFEIGGQPYLLNHILINNGFAADKDYGDRKYSTELKTAAAFAKRHDLGVWAQCGGFDVPLVGSSSSPSGGNQGLVDGGGTEQPSNGAGNGSGGSDQPVYVAPTEAPVYVAPTEPPVDQGGGCNPNYSGCVPNVSYDLDCKDIGYSVQVIGYDQYGLDRDGDGVGCESY